MHDLDETLDGLTQRDWQRAASGTVRFALVGLGGWTRTRALPAIGDSTLCETAVVVSGSAEKAERVAEEAPEATTPTPLTYDAFRAGDAVDEYDAVYVATPNALHLPYVAAAADHGKAVLCEKPLEATLERAERLVAACEDAGVPLMCAYRMQTDPLTRAARTAIRDGSIGDPAHVRGHMTQPVLEHGGPDQWRLDPDLAGYGTSVTDLGIYPLNTTRFLLDADPTSVTATFRGSHPAFDDVPDERASFSVSFPDDVVAECAASQNLAKAGELRVIGSAGELVLSPAFYGGEDRELVLRRGTTSASLSARHIDQMCEEFDYFADRVLTGRAPEPDGDHALVDMRAIAAVYEAAEHGERVRL
ncbi:D-xylose 1-dehydrogenase Gfo6 [Halorubrum sp. DTA98]|uniref:D-xylose 1-dehydrogenase Gfo6 n=1 Tax=Halorubrum sp. DTA98 TaxID=3402163 RepID=UPI003AB0CD5E